MKLLSAVASAMFLTVFTPAVYSQTLVPAGPTSPTLTVSGRGEVFKRRHPHAAACS